MNPSPLRRTLLLATIAGPFVAACAPTRVAPARAHDAQLQFEALAKSANGRLGVYAFDTANGARVAYRARERCPLDGAFAVVAAAALLARSALDPALLSRRMLYRRYDLVPDSPVTERHADTGMTVAQLCAAMLQAGDKSAANLLLGLLGGPGTVTAFARTIDDTTFHLDRWEPELNIARTGDERDTSTPLAMAETLRRLLLGDALGAAQRTQLLAWMTGDASDAADFLAALPSGSRVAHTHRMGAYGATTAAAIVWPPSRAPLALAISFTQSDADARPRDDVVASAARIAIAALATP